MGVLLYNLDKLSEALPYLEKAENLGLSQVSELLHMVRGTLGIHPNCSGRSSN
jgi:hypothetical protein